MTLAQREMNLKKRPQEIRHPAYVVRAPDPSNRGRWITLGYAWSRKNGEEGFTIKLNSVPWGNGTAHSSCCHPSPKTTHQTPRNQNTKPNPHQQ